MVKLKAPMTKADILSLKTGDRILLNGIIYAARDAAHKKFIELLESGRELPFDISGQIIYYVGPCPSPPDCVIGSAGPTTSGRMDAYTPRLLDMGLAGMIGKGSRSIEVIEAMKRNRAVYFGAVGGAGALISKSITASEVVAFEELGPEALRRLEVSDMPLTVLIDSRGVNLYETGKAAFRK